MNSTVPSDAPVNADGHTLSSFERLLAAAMAASILGVWALAFTLTPDPRGIGTHEQLGLAPCRMITLFGIPCVFCGMTTAFSLLARGDFVAAFATQPAAVVIAAATLPALIAALSSAISGGVPLWARRFTSSSAAWKSGLVIVILAWIYKVFAHL